jgi:hypothetical protein
MVEDDEVGRKPIFWRIQCLSLYASSADYEKRLCEVDTRPPFAAGIATNARVEESQSPSQERPPAADNGVR